MVEDVECCVSLEFTVIILKVAKELIGLACLEGESKCDVRLILDQTYFLYPLAYVEFHHAHYY